MSLEELLEVKITVASQTQETSGEAPSSVTVLTRKEFLAMGITSVEELLNFVPGFLTTREMVLGDGYRVAARGQTTPQSSYNILFMINGQRINSDLGGGAVENNRFLTLANVEQIEVIRGPGSALYGTSAFSGVVNIVTSTKANQVSVSGGNLGRREAHLNVSKEERNWQGSLFLGYNTDEGDDYSHFFRTPNATNSSFRKDPRRNKDMYLTLSWKNQLRMNFRHTNWETGAFGGRLPWYAIEGGQDSGLLSYQWVNTDTAQLVLEASYIQSELTSDAELMNIQAIQRLFPAPLTSTQEAASIKGIFSEQEWELGLNGHYFLSDRHRLYAGLSLRRPEIETFREQYNYDISQFNLDSLSGRLSYLDGKMMEVPTGKEGHRYILGIYFQDQYRFNPFLSMTLGIRHDNYSDFGGTTHPRLALIYQATPSTSFKLMYGEAFRAPSIRQLSGQNVGNPNLEPEEIKTVEGAWLQRYAMTQTTLTYFRNSAQNRIDTALISRTSRKFINFDDFDTHGWELETLANIGKEISLRMGYTYLLKTEPHPSRFPQQTFSMIANYQKGAWNLNLNTYYHDKTEQEIIGNIISLNDYWVVNGALRYTLSKGITLTGQINNLLDKKYFSSTKTASFQEGVPNRGRSYSIGVESTF